MGGCAEEAHIQAVQAGLLGLDERTAAIVVGHLLITSMFGFDAVHVANSFDLEEIMGYLKGAQKDETDKGMKELLGRFHEGVRLLSNAARDSLRKSNPFTQEGMAEGGFVEDVGEDQEQGKN